MNEPRQLPGRLSKPYACGVLSPRLRLPCYEPAGAVVEWDQSGLQQNILLVGNGGISVARVLKQIVHALAPGTSNPVRPVFELIEMRGKSASANSGRDQAASLVQAEPSPIASRMKLKAQFYELAASAQRSGTAAVLVWPDYHLQAEPEDLIWFAGIRDLGACVIATMPSLSALLACRGTETGYALLNCFGSLLLFRSFDPFLDQFAMTHFGTALIPTGMPDAGERPVSSVREVQIFQPICPPGALGSLAPDHAFVSLCDGRKFPRPLWLAVGQ